VWHQGYLQWHDLPTEFNINLLHSSKVIRQGTQTDTQNGELTGFTSILKYAKMLHFIHTWILCHEH
jgi:hypothetical protein